MKINKKDITAEALFKNLKRIHLLIKGRLRS
jgi:hypothetical protein